MRELIGRIVVPVASVEDAEATGRAIAEYLPDDGTVVAVHVIEKADGAPDKASVEQRELEATDIFDAVRDGFPGDVETEVRFGTDVAATIIAAAADHDAGAIVFTPRGGSRWVHLLTGDVATTLVEQSDRPVIVLPDVDEED